MSNCLISWRFLALGLAVALGGTSSRAWSEDWIYTVRPGDNLWDLSQRYLKDVNLWKPLQDLNAVADPEQLPPGQRLRIPMDWLVLQPSQARLIAVSGPVEVLSKGATAALAPTPGQKLFSGDKVTTGVGGSATLELLDGSRLLVEPNSQLRMDNLKEYRGTGITATQVRLDEGRMDTQVKRLPGTAPRFQIATPAATTTVRGTQYRVAMDPERDQASTEVLKGQVGVSNRQRSRLLRAGYGAVTEVGKPPSAPEPLLPPPGLGSLPPAFHLLPIRLNFPALPGASGYRLQIAADKDFSALVFDALADKPSFQVPDLPDGDLVLRLRAVAASGLEGREASQGFRVEAHPQPPFILEPVSGAKVRDPQLQFRWAQPEEARDYHLQLARDAKFADLVLDKPGIEATAVKTDNQLEPGQYYWRVATRDRSGKKGPFSDAQGIELRPLGDPGAASSDASADTLTLRWSRGQPGQRYQIQFAREREFQDLVTDQVLDEPELSLPRPWPGKYYLRLRLIDTDGYLGTYGKPQTIEVSSAMVWQAIIVVLTLVGIVAL